MTDTTMTIAQMQAAIEAHKTETRLKADTLKEERDTKRQEAEEAHKAYITFCDANGIPVKGKRVKA